ncbi:DUF1104 domain-containing protein [Helicobacter ailurogastricus]|uniref:Periplasmic protein n=1 Tax=Helicobacter ailurogastricus TaxID=1578720 RepID=A0A0K2XFP3_9HELI|nr:DUF1104 domain-containing protein [Helicobacter ailurogastricus]CRF41658.1 hypothetical protein HAL011_14660 [Helicobacter ailurogastricus]CRF42649.1 hypothetical protein HAL013_08440 [Helicobacter ailurogastricus]CRF44891.1 hypothetical protein HAL09_15110 [Helicobacter ailurogastricus]CRF52699.1 hypothetical protein HAL07_11640 [Helicobacter ailurogastricus]BDQ29836.1 hypothetical protein ASB7_16730 [Helicobacter ailurogastricus]
MKLLRLFAMSGVLVAALNAQTIGLNVFPEYQAKPDQEMLDMAGKVEAKKVIIYLSEMKNRYNKMTPKHKAEFQKHFQDVLAKNISKMSPSQRKKELNMIEKALVTRENNIKNLESEIQEEYSYIDHWKKVLQSGTFYDDLQKNGFNLPAGAKKH